MRRGTVSLLRRARTDPPALAGGPGAPAAVRDPGRARFRAAILGLAAAGTLFLAWLCVSIGGRHVRASVSDLVFVAAPLIAAAGCRRADRARAGRHRGWAWLTAACLTWAAGSITWTFYELVLHDVAPFPSYADIGYVGYSIPAAIGISRFPRWTGSVWSRWRLRLDRVVIGVSLLVTSLILVIGPVFRGTSPMTFTRLDALAYPIADVAVATIVITRCMMLPAVRRVVWFPLGAGLVALSFTDSVYVSSTFARHYQPGRPLDLGWALAFGLIAVASVAPDPDVPTVRADIPEPPSRFQELLPYGAVALAVVALFLGSHVGDRPRYYLWCAVPLAAVVIVRQWLVVSDHTTLAHDLARSVARRTEQLEHQEQWWRELVQNLSDVVMVLDADRTVRYCSPSVLHAIGRKPTDLTTNDELRDLIHPDDVLRVSKALRPVIAGARRQGFVECRLARADGSWGWFEVTARGQLAEQVLEGTVMTLHDVSERRQLTEQLEHQAYHDALTDLPNRALLMQRIEAALALRSRRRFALLLVDLDDFKVINDRYGHAAGDQVLEVIGRRLSKTVRSSDTVARLGGDEFALLVSGTRDHVQAVADRVIDQIRKPVAVGGRRFLVRASIGVVFAADDEAESPHSLLSHADIALYEAKAHDKGGAIFIDGPERAEAAKHVHLREQIVQPDLSQFSVVYQPIVDLADGHIRGVESLLRWQHPDLGNVPPDVFIPLAEYGGSIQVLGWHVLSTACAQLARWREEFPEHRLGVGINVSIRQLDEPEFAAHVLALIAEHGVDPDQIVLELTEQSLAVDFETAVAVVAELRAGGVSVAVDDYGTGYSSLRYLHRFAADVVKIDRSFVANLGGSVHTQKIVRSVVDMANSLDLQSIAEGIETPEQLGLARTLGCELGQGYLFSRPVPPAAIDVMLASGAHLLPDPESEPDPAAEPAESQPVAGTGRGRHVPKATVGV